MTDGAGVDALPMVEVIVEDDRWHEIGIGLLAERAAGATLLLLGLEPSVSEISLLAGNDARIIELNGTFRGRALPTNVLSWPSGEAASHGPANGAPAFLGDLALSFETCRDEAAAAGRAFESHVTHLVVHGVLHLLGYDHEREDEAEAMEEIEVKILDNLGIENPYT